MRQSTCIGILVLVGMLSAGDGSAQESTGTLEMERITALLTGGSQRAWVKTRWEHVLSEQVRKCLHGEIWVFGQEGKGVKRTCESGIVKQQEFSWMWAERQDNQLVIMIDETHYISEFRQKRPPVEGDPPLLVTILRTLRTSQDMPVEEIELEFQDM